MSSTKTVAVLGLGSMGLSIAKRIQSLGHTTKVWNRTPGKGTAAGLEEFDSPSKAVSSCDIAFIVVVDGKAIETVATDEFLDSLEPSTIIAVVSTVLPDNVRALAARRKSGSVIDAPYMGSPKHAIEGKGRFFVGSSDEVYSGVSPLLDAIGAPSIHAGEVGAGLVLKISSNLQLVIGVAALAESVAIARSHGVKDQVIFESFDKSIVVSGASKIRLPSVMDKTHPGWFTPALARKDVNLALTLAKEANLTSRLGEATGEMLDKVASGDWEDFTAVLEAVYN